MFSVKVFLISRNIINKRKFIRLFPVCCKAKQMRNWSQGLDSYEWFGLLNSNLNQRVSVERNDSLCSELDLIIAAMEEGSSSKATGVEMLKQNQQDHDRCPRPHCKLPHENNKHVLYCQHPTAVVQSESLVEHLHSNMLRIHNTSFPRRCYLRQLISLATRFPT